MLQGSWRTAQLQAVDTALEADDNVTLYCLFGFSLFVSIQFRQRVIYGKLKHRFTRQRKNQYYTDVVILQSLLETDGTHLPACIKFQDRGKMRFPQKSLLPFCRECSVAIKTYLTPSLYNQVGRKLVVVSHGHTYCQCIYITKASIFLFQDFY